MLHTNLTSLSESCRWQLVEKVPRGELIFTSISDAEFVSFFDGFPVRGERY